jgi:hypothetical protein
VLVRCTLLVVVGPFGPTMFFTNVIRPTQKKKIVIRPNGDVVHDVTNLLEGEVLTLLHTCMACTSKPRFLRQSIQRLYVREQWENEHKLRRWTVSFAPMPIAGRSDNTIYRWVASSQPTTAARNKTNYQSLAAKPSTMHCTCVVTPS